MFDRWSAWLLRLLRVPPQPDPPLGAPGSVRIFRAGRNAYRLGIAIWAFNQCFAVVGLVFWFWVFGGWHRLREANNHEPASRRAAVETPVPPRENADPSSSNRRRSSPRDVAAKFSRATPESVFGWLYFLEGLAVAGFVVQLPLTYALRRLEYEQRWYIVTDRSLRLRSGVWKVQEVTMSFANLQQITVSQDPIQRLLGLADVRVKSAGGAEQPGPHSRGEDTGHLGYFRSVDNAEEIRDLILARLRSFRESGLGDPDEARPAAMAAVPATEADTLDAARAALSESKALRATATALARGRS